MPRRPSWPARRTRTRRASSEAWDSPRAWADTRSCQVPALALFLLARLDLEPLALGFVDDLRDVAGARVPHRDVGFLRGVRRLVLAPGKTRGDAAQHEKPSVNCDFAKGIHGQAPFPSAAAVAAGG